jgi:hypothetical protein
LYVNSTTITNPAAFRKPHETLTTPRKRIAASFPLPPVDLTGFY